MLLCFSGAVHAQLIHGVTADGDPVPMQVNSEGQVVMAPLTAEDEPNVSLAGLPKNMTASGAIKSGAGRLVGVFVSTSSSCTIALHDNASAASGTVLLGTTATITAPAYFPLPVEFTNGAYFVEGGTCDVTFYYR